MTTAFPKLLYDKNKIAGFTSAVGGQLGVELGPADSLRDVASYIAPGNMSAQVVQMIELSAQYMKDSVGAADALLGNVNPEQASGTAISVASKQAGIPLENPRANMYNWLEDIGRIYLDMITNMYGERTVVMMDEDGAEAVEFDFTSLKGTYKQVKINVGPSTYWSAIAMKDTMDNLLAGQYIDFITYLEGMSDEFVPNRQQMIDTLKAAQKDMDEGSGSSEEQEFLAGMSPEDRSIWDGLTEEQKQQVYAEAQQGGV